MPKVECSLVPGTPAGKKPLCCCAVYSVASGSAKTTPSSNIQNFKGKKNLNYKFSFLLFIIKQLLFWRDDFRRLNRDTDRGGEAGEEEITRIFSPSRPSGEVKRSPAKVPTRIYGNRSGQVGGEDAGKKEKAGRAYFGSDLDVGPPAPESWMADCPLVRSSREGVTCRSAWKQAVGLAIRLSGESTSGVDVISQLMVAADWEGDWGRGGLSLIPRDLKISVP